VWEWDSNPGPRLVAVAQTARTRPGCPGRRATTATSSEGAERAAIVPGFFRVHEFPYEHAATLGGPPFLKWEGAWGGNEVGEVGVCAQLAPDC
jgi:hypothetical protein